MKLRTQLSLGYATVFTLFVLMAVLSYQSTRSLLETYNWVEQTREIMNSGRLIERTVLDMEVGKRGFLITGAPDFLKPYDDGLKVYNTEIKNLKRLIGFNPTQTKCLEEIDALITAWLTTTATLDIEGRYRVNRGEYTLEALAQRIAGEGAERSIFPDIREKMRVFLDNEQTLLEERQAAAALAVQNNTLVVIGGIILAVLLGITIMLIITRGVLRQIGGEPAEIAAVTEEIARGNLDIELEGGTGIRAAAGRMLKSLKENRAEIQRQDWLKTGIARLNQALSGALELELLASRVITEMTTYLGAQLGALYIACQGAKPVLTLKGSYACTKQENLPPELKLGEGLVGQAAAEGRQILLEDIPADYIKVCSGLGACIPRSICITPFLYEGHIKGVIEIGTLHAINEPGLEYLRQAMPILAVSIESAQNSVSLKEYQRINEELQVQQEELKAANEELEEQAQRLKESEERLKAQQEEMEVTNEELKEKNELLEYQKQTVENARKDLAVKAEEIVLASKYKSEFLANMSHELRTPLNSLLLLSQDLARNREHNLTAQQVESAKVIYSSGSDLLNLINEVLDLSKIEAGRMDIHVGSVRINQIAASVRTFFSPLAEEKGLKLEVIISENAPAEIMTDRKRVEQVLRNLVANAIKFTEQGSVTVVFSRPDQAGRLAGNELGTGECLAIAVKDTGIGIAQEHQKNIFEAFQQADGGTSRKYGGTGLGLSIAKELTSLLGGKIQVESEPGQGSTFVLYLPIVMPAAGKGTSTTRTVVRAARSVPGLRDNVPHQQAVVPNIKDDRGELKKNERAVLVIEDDVNFARMLLEKCHDRGFKCLLAATGTAGLALAVDYNPSAIILDIRLPDMSGWVVLNSLKEDTRTRHIPVHIVSVEERSAEAMYKGAIGHAVKPVDHKHIDDVFYKLEKAAPGKPKRLLVIEDDAALRRETVGLIGNGDVKVDEAGTGSDALQAIRTGSYDCIILDLRLPDMSGEELLAKLKSEGIQIPPVIVYTARSLSCEEEMLLREYAESIIIKDVRSRERLLDEVSLFLHRVVSRMPEKKQKIIRDLYDTDALLRDRKVLIVDDDMRTTFALAHLLSERGMRTLKAENGEKALRLLHEQPDVELVLMDIMMPVMDGYETMKRIRTQERFRNLPIIVLTAKAMPDDREKSLKAGANDYLAKPVDQQRLISLLRVWLYR